MEILLVFTSWVLATYSTGAFCGCRRARSLVLRAERDLQVSALKGDVSTQDALLEITVNYCTVCVQTNVIHG
ncbi:hypothetical protein Y1Q_0013230 [Alligator mississippiensis]|uniref:Secreted protein n=1 Tax=Alligator mississippiensis TaxID=8496 RepID=A0A151NVG2_ALLMI|nr:hypothetical protein Y1Q_0013230 [Alligator mississippiensis]